MPISSTDGPVGKPQINPRNTSKYENEEVTMTCDTRVLDNGNSECREFTWYKNKDRTFPRTFKDNNQLQFIMKDVYEGTYQCRCENGYGESEKSDVAVLEFLNSTSASKFFFVNSVL